MELTESFELEQRPVQILDRQERQLRSKVVPLVKVRWQGSGVEDVTWELEAKMRTEYPDLF